MLLACETDRSTGYIWHVSAVELEIIFAPTKINHQSPSYSCGEPHVGSFLNRAAGFEIITHIHTATDHNKKGRVFVVEM